MTSPDPEVEPPGAEAIFGDQLTLARSYADLLADAGVVRGLIGPREVAVLWSRHLLNCAVVTDAIDVGARVVDVGSGAGLPGLVLAVRRTDLRVDLVEPLERRCTFLREAVDLLGVGDRVRVIRGRAESAEVRSTAGGADVVTSRAVAALDRLVGWSLPLARTGGRMVALKGERAVSEIDAAQRAISRSGGSSAEVVEVGAWPHTARVVVVEKRRPTGREKEHRSR